MRNDRLWEFMAAELDGYAVLFKCFIILAS